ncbi:MAG: Nif3-like dinuclear metal center hexameric protein [Candidatus Electronema sp. V4]|uniref:Nif3-like dinuclear metal center hexameric protein n=1 Tax=Candidatus Electronema sp. V4 TaxID=3454756 RepID=UPI0040557CF8
MSDVQQFIDILEEIAPAALAASWDNVGLLVGSPRRRVSAVLLALDPAAAAVAEAQALAADLIITHHPAIFQPLKQLRTDQPGGAFLAAALWAGISVIACHTNFDAASGGISDVLSEALGLTGTAPLTADKIALCCGIGRIGSLPEPLPPEAFLNRLRSALPLPWLLEAGPRPAAVRRVAVCGGSCADLAEAALAAGADVFFTAEIKHHVARWAEEAGLWLLDGGHFATENPAMNRLWQQLTVKTQQAGLDVQIHLAAQESPLRLVRQNSEE